MHACARKKRIMAEELEKNHSLISAASLFLNFNTVTIQNET